MKVREELNHGLASSLCACPGLVPQFNHLIFYWEIWSMLFFFFSSIINYQELDAGFHDDQTGPPPSLTRLEEDQDACS